MSQRGITRRPVLSAAIAAAALCLAALLVMVLVFPGREAQWAPFIALLLYPFVWFFAWVFINALAWWRDNMEPRE